MTLILFLGPPGSGKGSLAQKLQKDLNFIHFSTGKIFRALKAKQIDSGELISDDYVNDLVYKELCRLNKESKDATVILDGYPRTIAQAEFLKKYFPIDKVFLLSNISVESIIERLNNRLLCEKEDHSFNLKYKHPKVPGICDYDGSKLYRRTDDSGEVILKRLAVYESHTQPLIDFYEKLDILFRLDASSSTDDMILQVSKHLKT